MPSNHKSIISAGIGGSVLATLICAWSVGRPAHAAPPAALTTNPLVLSAVALPFTTMPAPAPTTVNYTLTSSGGPFCVVGLPVHSFPESGANDVFFGLERIDGGGLSHGSFLIFDASSGGTHPLDIILSYGNPICATSSLEFGATQFGPGGADVDVFGTAIISAAANVTVSVEVE